jgi:hypothetical protein
VHLGAGLPDRIGDHRWLLLVLSWRPYVSKLLPVHEDFHAAMPVGYNDGCMTEENTIWVREVFN